MLAAVAATCASPARAQVSFTLSADSDYRVRGISLSDGKPDLSLSLAYDHSSGLYAGASLLADENLQGGARMLGALAYAGYSTRITDGLAWDIGAEYAHISDQASYRIQLPAPDPPVYPATGLAGSSYVLNIQRRYDGDYSEVYAGLVGGGASVRLSYSPDYLDEHVQTLYLDLSGSVRPAPRWRLFGHVGALTPVGGSGQPMVESGYERYDLRAGAAFELKDCELRLVWTSVRPSFDYPFLLRQRKDALVFGASYFF